MMSVVHTNLWQSIHLYYNAFLVKSFSIGDERDDEDGWKSFRDTVKLRHMCFFNGLSFYSRCGQNF